VRKSQVSYPNFNEINENKDDILRKTHIDKVQAHKAHRLIKKAHKAIDPHQTKEFDEDASSQTENQKVKLTKLSFKMIMSSSQKTFKKRTSLQFWFNNYRNKKTQKKK